MVDTLSLSWRRLFVWGFPCAGKTTLARKIAAARALDLVEIDALTFEAGWKMLTRAEIEAKFLERISKCAQGWVVDGNYPGISRLVLPDTDAVIWLDLPFSVVFGRALKRSALAVTRGTLQLGHSRMTIGKSVDLLKFLVNEQRQKRIRDKQIYERLQTAGHEVALVRLTSTREVEEFSRMIANV